MEVVPKGGVPGSIDPRRIERGQAMRASQNRVARAYNKKAFNRIGDKGLKTFRFLFAGLT